MADSVTRPVEAQTDGAIHELARDDMERKKFLKMAGKGMGAAISSTPSSSSSSDAGNGGPMPRSCGATTPTTFAARSRSSLTSSGG